MGFFFDLSDDLMCVLGIDLGIQVTNLSFEATLKYTKDELTPKKFIELVHGDDQQSTNEHLARLNVETGPIKFENRMLSKDGANEWLSWTFEKSPDFRNLVLAVGKNITNEKAAQSELILKNRAIAEEKAKTDAMLENIGDGIIGINDTGEIIFVNGQTTKMLGFDESELIGKPFFHTVIALDDKGNPAPIERRPIHHAFKNNVNVTSRELSYKAKSGKAIAVSITASPVMLQGMLIGGVIVFRDITKEKEVDRMKTEFISLASHQLRTPLSAMKWFSEMLIDGDTGELNPEQKEIVNNIYQSNERMIQLVNALLNISRIESGRIIIDPVPTNLKELIDSVVLELQPKIMEKKHHLGVSVHEGLPTINIDPKLIRHVYMNLLTNAVKYTPAEGEIVVMISRSGDEIISQISDNGYGIPELQKEHVFQKFFRADNIVKVETDGTGLGLYLIKSIVHSSGGRIWFESEEGKGSTFWFSLPITGSQPKKGEVTIDA